MTKKGNKTQFHNMEVPLGSEFANQFKAREEVNLLQLNSQFGFLFSFFLFNFFFQGRKSGKRKTQKVDIKHK